MYFSEIIKNIPNIKGYHSQDTEFPEIIFTTCLKLFGWPSFGFWKRHWHWRHYPKAVAHIVKTKKTRDKLLFAETAVEDSVRFALVKASGIYLFASMHGKPKIVLFFLFIEMEENWKDAKDVYEFSCKDIKGNEISFTEYEGNVLLIVNVASRCGYTAKNYKGLVRLHEAYGDKGLQILAFPCNQFGKQEPGTNEAICKYTEKKGVKFTVFDKVQVNGEDAHPLWKYLKEKVADTKGERNIRWNFTKFLINREGQPQERFAPSQSFEKIEEAIKKLL